MKHNFFSIAALSGLLLSCGSGETPGAAEQEVSPAVQAEEKVAPADVMPVIPGKSTWQAYSFNVNVLPYEGNGSLILTMRYQAFQHQEKYPLAGAEEVVHTISADLDKNENPEVYSLVRTREGLKCWGLSFINTVQPVELTLDKIGVVPENSRWLATTENGLQLLGADSIAVESIAVSTVDGKMKFELQ